VLFFVLVAEFAVRRGWAYHQRPTDLDGWWGRSTREPGEVERSGVNAGVVAMAAFLLTVTLVLLFLGFLLGG